LALYVLTLTVQDPDMMPKVEIANEKPLPFKYAGGKGGKGGRGRGGNRGNSRGGDRRRDNRDGRDGGGRRDFKRTSNKNKRDFQDKDNKRPNRTSSEKKNGFVIRNKGER